MTTITNPEPLPFWACGGDVFARIPGEAPAILSDDESWDVLTHLEIERRACERSGDRATRARVMLSAMHLTCARMQASRWNRASGCISDISRKAA